MGAFKAADRGQVEKALKGERIVHGVDQQVELACRRLLFGCKWRKFRFRGFHNLFLEQLDVVSVVPEIQELMDPGDGQGEEHKACEDDGYAHG